MSRIAVASKKPFWIALFIVLLFHAALVSVQAGRRIDTRFVRVWIIDALAPAEKLVDRTVYGVTYVWSSYFALIGVQRENDRLTAEIAELKMVLERQREEVLEAERLRTLLSIQQTNIGKSVVARVVGRDPTRTNQTVTIDKGKTHGVRPDTAVITHQGIVGRVVHASNFFAIVQLVVDSQSGIGVIHRPTRRQGILKGSGGRDLDLDYIEDDNDLNAGDEFITSGMDRIYPKGLPVGVIAFVGPRVGLFKTVQVRPKADLEQLEEVLCIVERPQEIDIVDPNENPPSL